MKNQKILNPELVSAVAALGHTQYFVIADAGLPIPDGVYTIDLSVTKGIPSFAEVLKAVCSELVVESYIYAAEIKEKNPKVLAGIEQTLGETSGRAVSHEEFKALTVKAGCIVRTGECSPYANVILVGGVNF